MQTRLPSFAAIQYIASVISGNISFTPEFKHGAYKRAFKGMPMQEILRQNRIIRPGAGAQPQRIPTGGNAPELPGRRGRGLHRENRRHRCRHRCADDPALGKPPPFSGIILGVHERELITLPSAFPRPQSTAGRAHRGRLRKSPYSPPGRYRSYRSWALTSNKNY